MRSEELIQQARVNLASTPTCEYHVQPTRRSLMEPLLSSPFVMFHSYCTSIADRHMCLHYVRGCKGHQYAKRINSISTDRLSSGFMLPHELKTAASLAHRRVDIDRASITFARLTSKRQSNADLCHADKSRFPSCVVRRGCQRVTFAVSVFVS